MRDVVLCAAVLAGLLVVLVQLVTSGADGGAVVIVAGLVWVVWRVLRSRFVTRR